MITRPTVLILGAGASYPYGFPTGLQLKARICKALMQPGDYAKNDVKREMRFDEDLLVYWAIRNLDPGTDSGHILFLKHEPQKVENSIKNFVDSFANDLMLSPDASIDAFLEHHPEYVDLGHRAIAGILLPYETRKSLFDDWIDKWNDPSNEEKHWYQLLFGKLNTKLEDFDNNQLSIVTFNYDRSLEYFLWQAIKAKYKEIDWELASQKLRTIPIVHLYGKLGSLFRCEDETGPCVPYGGIGRLPRALQNRIPNRNGDESVLLCDHIDKASECINTIHEEYAPDNPSFVKARELIKNADRIYFLGFGYHEENMKRLFTDHESQEPYNILKGAGDHDNARKGPKCFGTALGISPHQQKKLGERGLDNMRGDYGYRYRHHNANRNSMWFFPETTIWDFLYHSPHSTFD